MIPFLKQRKYDGGGAITTEYRKPDAVEKPTESDSDTSGLEAAAADLMEAIHARDKKLAVQALNSFFEIRESMPHVEGEHLPDDQE